MGETRPRRTAARNVVVDKTVDDPWLYWPLGSAGCAKNSRRSRRSLSSREAHLPAQRPTPQAQARLPRPHVYARRAVDPQAPPREGPRAPLGV